MKLQLDQLPAHLQGAAQKGLAPLYTVHGDEILLVQEAVDAVRAAARAAGYTERQVHTVSGAHFDWSGLLGATQSMSLFGDLQWIEIRIPSGKPGVEGAKALQQLAQAQRSTRGPCEVVTLIELPKLDGAQKKSEWFKALEACGPCVEVPTLTLQALPAWIQSRLHAQGQSLPSGEAGAQALKFLLDRVEGHLLAAHQEILKLGLLYPPGPLRLEQVQDAVLHVARYSVPQLSEAVLSGHVRRSIKVLQGLQAEGESVVMVLWWLCEDLRTLQHVRQSVAQGTPPGMALDHARVWGAKAPLMERLLRGLSDAGLRALLDDAHCVDGLTKGLHHPDWPAEPWAAVERLVLKILEHTAAWPGKPAGQHRPFLPQA